jgi:Kef-type K+ transport system membrane component KefB
VAWLLAWGLLGWTLKASIIAGTALSTTSLAVVYAVLVETGLNATRIGKLILSACFLTDMGTALALSAIFITPNAWFPLFLAVSVALIVGLPKIARWFFRRYGDRVIEPEIKLVFVVLFVLMVLANRPTATQCCPRSCSASSWRATISSPARSSSAYAWSPSRSSRRSSSCAAG